MGFANYSYLHTGASCDGASLFGRVEGSVWRTDLSLGVYILERCPLGYILRASTQECTGWSYANYVQVVAYVAESMDIFFITGQGNFTLALASAAAVPLERVMVASMNPSRRSKGSLKVIGNIAADNTSNAALILNSVRFDLAEQLISRGFSVISLEMTVVAGTDGGGHNGDLLIGIIAGCVAFFCITLAIGYRGMHRLLEQKSQKLFFDSIRSAVPGQEAGLYHLPVQLRSEYSALSVLGMGAFGCVIKAEKRRAGSFASSAEFKLTRTSIGSSFAGSFSLKRNLEETTANDRKLTDTGKAQPTIRLMPAKAVAIKLILPGNGKFSDKEIRQLRREEALLELFTANQCEYAVHLAGIQAAYLQPDMCWFVMELLEGDNVETLIRAGDIGLFDSSECVRLARNILTALKVMHAEGLVHRDIKPANVMRCFPPVIFGRNHGAAVAPVYKLIDFGTALGIDETLAKEEMMTVSSSRQMGVGTLPYMSPEMFREPLQASYPTDLWSLGISLYESASGCLPFQAESDLLWSTAIAGDMNVRVKFLLDALDQGRRANFDHNLAKAIAKALEKRVADR